MTEATSVRCQHCGAALQISDGLRFVTCGYCHTVLQIIRDASTVHTEVMGKIEAHTEAMAGSLKAAGIHDEIARLDREWEVWKQTYLPRSRNGSFIDPKARMVFALLACGVICARLAVTGVHLGSGMIKDMDHATPSKEALLALVFCIGSCAALIWYALRSWTRAHNFNRTRDKYENQRNALLRQLNHGQGAASFLPDTLG
ncbi:MAG: hypothetical protein JWO94_2173 [Verrucomicrobiaceae bacterium]|nr:hypothetical protein [Verrucomicrobiaceae bacterium]